MGLGRKIANGMMLSCRKATEFIERKSDSDIGIFASMQLWMHFQFCKFCKRYEGQSKLLDRVFHLHFHDHSHENKPEESFSSEAKSKVIRRLEDQI